MSAKELSHQIETNIFTFTEKHGFRLLAFSIGLIYVWFGMLKFFPGFSPAEALAGDTLAALTFGLVPTWILLWGLAAWEVLIGISLVLNLKARWIFGLLLLHMLGTMIPFVLFPNLTFAEFPIPV